MRLAEVAETTHGADMDNRARLETIIDRTIGDGSSYAFYAADPSGMGNAESFCSGLKALRSMVNGGGADEDAIRGLLEHYHAEEQAPVEHLHVLSRLGKWAKTGSPQYLVTERMQRVFHTAPLGPEAVTGLSLNIPYPILWAGLEEPWPCFARSGRHQSGRLVAHLEGLLIAGYRSVDTLTGVPVQRRLLRVGPEHYSDYPWFWIIQPILSSKQGVFWNFPPLFFGRKELGLLREGKDPELVFRRGINKLTALGRDAELHALMTSGRSALLQGVSGPSRRRASQGKLNAMKRDIAHYYNPFARYVFRYSIKQAINLMQYLTAEKTEIVVYRNEPPRQRRIKVGVDTAPPTSSEESEDQPVSRVSRIKTVLVDEVSRPPLERTSGVSVKPHWRAGHYHTYWVGSKTGPDGLPQKGEFRVVKWVPAVWVGKGDPGDAPLYIV